MEYFQQDMKSYLDSAATGTIISEKQVLVILYNMLCSIESLHKRGVMHRDIKPANMMINDDCDVALVDFGLSKVCNGN